MVERNLAKVEVASSSLVSRSNPEGKPRFPFSLSAWRARNPARIATMLVQFGPWRGGRVVMQRPAKPCTPVRFRPPPPRCAKKALSHQGFFFFAAERCAQPCRLGQALPFPYPLRAECLAVIVDRLHVCHGPVVMRRIGMACFSCAHQIEARHPIAAGSAPAEIMSRSWALARISGARQSESGAPARMPGSTIHRDQSRSACCAHGACACLKHAKRCIPSCPKLEGFLYFVANMDCELTGKNDKTAPETRRRPMLRLGFHNCLQYDKSGLLG